LKSIASGIANTFLLNILAILAGNTPDVNLNAYWTCYLLASIETNIMVFLWCML